MKTLLTQLLRWLHRRPLHSPTAATSRSVHDIAAKIAGEREAADSREAAVIDPPTVRMHRIVEVDGGRPVHELDYVRSMNARRMAAGVRWGN